MYETKKLDQLYYNCTALGGIVCPIFYHFNREAPPPLNEVKVGDESVFSFKKTSLFCRTYVCFGV
ncbi:hypothetical protein CN564_17350 [Bacillus pseudomycoides]|nr:hypothetical protein CN564_17350 [Bacillus pseudomycoides]